MSFNLTKVLCTTVTVGNDSDNTNPGLNEDEKVSTVLIRLSLRFLLQKTVNLSGLSQLTTCIEMLIM